MAKETLTATTLGGLKVEAVGERADFMNILIYGPSGVGKTTLAGSAAAVPEMGRVVVIDVEGGDMSLTHSYPNAEVVRVTTWKDLQAIYNELYDQKGAGFGTCVLDSLTEIQKFSMYGIMGDLIKKEPDRDPDIPSMREWGKNIEQIRRFVRGFRDLPMNTIFTALDKEDKDGKTGKITIKPSLSGKLAGEVAAFLDIVVYMYSKEVGVGDDAKLMRLLLTGATEKNIAKDRSGKLPLIVEEPTMRALYDLMHGKNTLITPATPTITPATDTELENLVS